MKKDDDRNWSAYIDSELSVSEIEAFEAKLSVEELEHLRKEKAFEEAIGSKLSEAPCCPENLFADVKKELAKGTKRPFAKYATLAAVAIAACILFVFLLPKAGTTGNKVPMTVAELKSQSLTGDQLDDVNKFLSERGISLELTSVAGGHHAKNIIGAGIELVAGEDVVTLMFTCCGRPAKVYLLPKGSKAEELIVNDNKDWKSSIQALVKKGNYRLAVSSPHNSESILNYINQS